MHLISPFKFHYMMMMMVVIMMKMMMVLVITFIEFRLVDNDKEIPTKK